MDLQLYNSFASRHEAAMGGLIPYPIQQEPLPCSSDVRSLHASPLAIPIVRSPLIPGIGAEIHRVWHI